MYGAGEYYFNKIKRMNNVSELNLETEVIPLFDYTLNTLAREKLVSLFLTPLKGPQQITERQDILRGFLSNIEYFDNYHYARSDFDEVYIFLKSERLLRIAKVKKWQLLLSKTTKHAVQSPIIQLIYLFNKIESGIKEVKREFFPVEYRATINCMLEFLATFNTGLYIDLIREDKFGTGYITSLLKQVADSRNTRAFEVFFDNLGLFEAFLSISQCIRKNNFSFPVLDNQSFKIENLYHPVLENPVKNSFEADRNVILLTGSNMSGKSTFLKSVALCVYLAHIGIGIPAGNAVIPFFDHISVSINHNDDIRRGYSHFMNEIIRLKKVLLRANEKKRCFAVFDELFKGTNIEDALAISRKTISGLAKFENSCFFISTHLHQLKEQEEVVAKKVKIYYLDTSVANGVPVFSFELKEGWSDLKVGTLLFEAEGLNELLTAKTQEM